MISFTQALKLGTALPQISRTHNLELFQAHNAILSQDIFASRPLPPFDNSAMDGYAILLQDYDRACLSRGKILAGDDSTHITLTQGETYKVMTGSMLPQNTQAVIQIEMAQEQNGKVSFTKANSPIKQGLNIRYKGEEIQQDSLLLRKGKRLNHLDLSILASQGISRIESFVPLKIESSQAVMKSLSHTLKPKSIKSTIQMPQASIHFCILVALRVAMRGFYKMTKRHCLKK